MVLLAVGFVVFLGVAGSAVDFARLSWRSSKLQQVLDNAVLAGVSNSGSAERLSGVDGGLNKAQRIKLAVDYFNGNKENLPNPENISFQFDSGILVGRANKHVATYLLRIIGINTFDVSRTSSATHDLARAPLCFMAMHPTRKHTLELNDSVSVIAPDCNIYGNSNHIDDVVDPHTPANFLVGKSIQAVGYGHHYLPNVTPPLEHAPETIPDPLASMALPVPGPCTATNFVVNSGFATLNPGTYCGGLSIQNGADVTLNPGLYILSGGEFEVSAAQVSGDEVTVALADASVKLDFDAATVRLSAPKSGQYASMVLIGVRDPIDHTFNNSTLDLHGVVYLLGGAIDWTNSGAPVINAKWSAWIIDGVSWQGDGTIRYNFDIASSDIPYPPSLNVIPRPGEPRLVK